MSGEDMAAQLAAFEAEIEELEQKQEEPKAVQEVLVAAAPVVVFDKKRKAEQPVIGPQGPPRAVPASTSSASTTSASKKQKVEEEPKRLDKTFLRTSGDKVWEDKTLQEWPDDDFRLWVGQLGNEVNDDMLAKVFSKYPSYNKCRVVRNPHTNQSKGYGFVSFSDPMEMVRAMRENQGKWCGTRMMKIKRSRMEDRDFKTIRKEESKRKKRLKKLGMAHMTNAY